MEFIVKRTGKTFGIFAKYDDGREELVEGGFFEWSAAVEARDEFEADALRAEVEIAERKAGWDPNP